MPTNSCIWEALTASLMAVTTLAAISVEVAGMDRAMVLLTSLRNALAALLTE